VVVCSLLIDPADAARLAERAGRLAGLYPDWMDDSLCDLSGIEAEEIIGKVVAAWALGALNEVRGYLHDAGAVKTSGGATIWVGFHHPQVTLLAIELAARAVAMSITRDDFSPAHLSPDLEKLWQVCRRHHPDYQARILMTAARERGIPVLHFVPGTKYWQYGWGARSRVFMESLSNGDGNLGGTLAISKPLSKAVFASLGVPAPRHVLVSDARQLQEAALAVDFPCVLKPVDMSGGQGVTANIQNVPELQLAYEQGRLVTSGPLMVEQFVPGDDHRLMVVGGKLAAAIRREPSSVVGDGLSTVRQLVDMLNSGRSSNMPKSRYLRPVALDDVLASHLAKQELDIDSVPRTGVRVTLRSNSNVSTGGVATDVTQHIHPEVKALAEQLAATIGLETAGLDYLTADISRSPLDGGGTFIEMNTTPALDVLIAAGWQAGKIGSLVLGAVPGRIPIELSVVANVNTEAPPTQDAACSTAAWVCGSELQVGRLKLQIRDPAPWAAVHSALRNKTVTSLNIVCSKGEILAHGLPVDRLDRVNLRGVTLPGRWQRLVERCAGSVEVLDGIPTQDNAPLS
jgi:cyanophycin synthetase